MMDINGLVKKFYQVFGDDGKPRVFFAPGRVNLIGEHTDYNGGNVFPCALDIGTYAVARKREDNLIRGYSSNIESFGIIEAQIESLSHEVGHDWFNYPKGVVSTLGSHGHSIENGFDVLYHGTIPNGSGLSSSASLEILTGVVVRDLFDLEVTMMELVKISKQAENEFNGVNCGIMDQFAVGFGKKNHAVLLDCNTLEYEYTPIELGGNFLVIGNTNKKRTLAASAYNQRCKETANALKALQSALEIKSLGELSIEEFEKNKHLIEDGIERKRAKHAVYENQRTIQAVKELNGGNIHGFGQLMNESHKSLKEDYEVTGEELDTMVQLAWNHKGTIGSRMTGAGFGGCTVSIVKEDLVESFIEKVGQGYEEIIGYPATFYVVAVGDGPRELTEVLR